MGEHGAFSEVRVPLVDIELLQGLAPALVSQQQIDGKVLLGNSPSQPLPSTVVARAKTGFETPVGDWLQRMPAL
ncbi:MAG: asparagine synthase-related protein [Candidatus Competibacteraceae bacterium]